MTKVGPEFTTDWHDVVVGPAGVGASTSTLPADHGILTGLADDDHSAYALVTGGGEETVQNHGNAGSTETINPASGNVHALTLDAATCTVTLTAPTASVACSLLLELHQDATGSRAISWPASVVWPGGVAPTLTTTALAVDFIVLYTRDGGTTWYGFTVGGQSSSGSSSSSSVGAGEILISDTVADPITFSDLLTTEDGLDLLYAD